MAETVVRAHEELAKSNRALFCKAIGLNPKGSKVRKMKRSGRARPGSSSTSPYCQRTGPPFTNSPSDRRRTFERLKASGALQPHATWAELEKALGPGSKKQKKKDAECARLLRSRGDPHQRRRDFLNRLTELGTAFDLKPQPTKAAEAMIAQPHGRIRSKLNDDVQERRKEYRLSASEQCA